MAELVLRIETRDGSGPYNYAALNQYPHREYRSNRQPTPHDDLRGQNWHAGSFGFPTLQALTRWFRYSERLRLQAVHSEVTWGVAVYRTPTIYARSARQCVFNLDDGERIAFLPIQMPAALIRHKLRELTNG